MALNPVVAEVTDRIVVRSRQTRADYLRRMDAGSASGPGRAKLSCANWAHAFAGQTVADKLTAMTGAQPNLGVVTALGAVFLGRRYRAVFFGCTRDVSATRGRRLGVDPSGAARASGAVVTCGLRAEGIVTHVESEYQRKC